MDSLDEILYDALTWPEINEAALARKVVLLPIGSTEQHGLHLPLDVDNFLARSMCLAAARLAPRELLVMPTIPYGYNEHALDFPGTIHVTYHHFIEYCLDVVKSVAHAGFEACYVSGGATANVAGEFSVTMTFVGCAVMVGGFMPSGVRRNAGSDRRCRPGARRR